MLTSATVLLAGLTALVVGAELVVRGGSALASRSGISPLVIGLTVVSLGTSLPELAIGLNAARQGNAGLAVGNIVGTNLVNILLILGLSALIRPLTFQASTLRFDLPAMTGAALLFFVLARDGSLTAGDGMWLSACGAVYLVALIARTRWPTETPTPPLTAGTDTPAADASPGAPVVHGSGGVRGRPPAVRAPRSHAGVRAVLVQTLVLGLGLLVIVVGSEWLVDGAVEIASRLRASDALIGLTVVAVGTSAPELATTLVSTVRGDRSIALGNLLGSSVFNIALVLGPTVLASPAPVRVPDDVLAFDLVLMVATALVCVPAFLTGRRLGRREGSAFVTTYLLYLGWLLLTRL